MLVLLTDSIFAAHRTSVCLRNVQLCLIFSASTGVSVTFPICGSSNHSNYFYIILLLLLFEVDLLYMRVKYVLSNNILFFLSFKSFIQLRTFICVHRHMYTCVVKLFPPSNQETKVPVAKIMHTWTLQMGFPVVSIGADSSKNLGGNQTWFLLDPSKRKEAPHSNYK